MTSRAGIGLWPLALTIALVTGVQGRAQAGPTTPTLTVSLDPLTPYSSGGCYRPEYPCYRAFGKADPGAKVVITVTDDVNSGLSIAAATFAAAADDPGAGIEAGEYSASPNVTDLGLHGTEPSRLTFTVVAQDTAGNTSAPAVATVTKLAATSGDFKGPQVTVETGKAPPAFWCSMWGNCFSLFNVFQPTGRTGEAAIGGSVEDDSKGAFGLASEVADVIVTVTRRSDGAVVKEFHPFIRRGTQAFFGALIRVRDFERGQSYRWSVEATDAWGHKGNVVEGSFTVMF